MLLLENLQDIEQTAARNEMKTQQLALSKLVGSEEICVVYAARSSEPPIQTIISLGSSENEMIPISSFTVMVWVAPAADSASMTELSIESWY